MKKAIPQTPMSREDFIATFKNSPYAFNTCANVAVTVSDNTLRKAAKRYVEARGNLRRILKDLNVELKDE